MSTLQRSESDENERAKPRVHRLFGNRSEIDRETSEAIDQVKAAIKNLPNGSSECRMLLASVLALVARIEARRPRRALEIMMLLCGVVQLAVCENDPDKGRVLYQEAYAAFAQSARSGNQLRFFGGAALGAATMGISTACVIFIQTLRPAFLKQLAESDVVVGVAFFALAGSLVSILVRLHKIDLVEEDETWMVVLTGALQPTVAMGFMCVVYVIVAAPLIPISLHDPQLTGFKFAAAFLCGFSEKFAPALLDRVEGSFSGRDKLAEVEAVEQNKKAK